MAEHKSDLDMNEVFNFPTEQLKQFTSIIPRS